MYAWPMWNGWPLWWIFPLLMMAFIAACVFFIMHRMPSSSAVQLLSERFARGEISKEEFEEKRTILRRK